MFILAHLTEKAINPPIHTHCLPPNMSKPPGISLSFFFVLSTSSTVTSQGRDDFHISPSISSPKSFKVEEIEALVKGLSVHSAVTWRFLYTNPILRDSPWVLSYWEDFSVMLGNEPPEKNPNQEHRASAGETSHEHFYYTVLQDLIFLLKELINSPLSERYHSSRLAIKSAFNTMYKEIQ